MKHLDGFYFLCRTLALKSIIIFSFTIDDKIRTRFGESRTLTIHVEEKCLTDNKIDYNIITSNAYYV